MPLRPLVDTPFPASVSFPPAERPVPSDRDPALLAVGPGRPPVLTARSLVLPAELDGYDVQIAKVQPPALREETLERPRLLDWLKTKIHGRVVLLLADAGYGKTTLLADFSRRTRLRTLWYRLDETDRDWTSFLRHLVAAGREHDPEFAPATAALLREIGVTGPSRETVLETFLRELPTITGQGAVLIFDDVHLVDDAPDVRHIGRELLARAPERLTLVFASRRMPAFQLSRLRAVGEVAELDTDELRFDAHETAQLFNETYGRNLEADVLLDLAQRTEGWIASLQLVHAALRDRSPAEIRRFVRTLNGADHDMYDYLAEEVVGDLSEELQRFLMDTSILQVVTPELAEVVTGHAAADVSRLTAAAERLTLLSRLTGGPRTHQRYHPLVREFLEARFRSIDGEAAVAELHRRTALAVAGSDWRTAAHHYREAGDTADMLATISAAIPTIMGNAQYALAETFIGPIAAEDRPPGFDLILSRVEMQQGDYAAAIAASQAVLDSTSDPIQRDYALLNLVTLHLNQGNGDEAIRLAQELLTTSSDHGLRAIAVASEAVVRSSDDGPIEPTSRMLRRLARQQRETSVHHYGVSMYNVALFDVVLDRLEEALADSVSAAEAFASTSAGLEHGAANAIRAAVLLALGRGAEAESLIGELFESPSGFVEVDAYVEIGAAVDSYGDGSWSRRLLERVGGGHALTVGEQRGLSNLAARWHLRRGDFDEARRSLAAMPPGLGVEIGQAAERLATAAYIEVAAGSQAGLELATRAIAHADRQGAVSWRRVASLLASTFDDSEGFSDRVIAIGRSAPWHLSFLADVFVPRLHLLSDTGLGVVERAALLHPQRWRRELRGFLDRGPQTNALAAARLLEEVGERQDVARLRSLAKRGKRNAQTADLGRTLARRVADRIWVEDQGKTIIVAGDRSIPGTSVRRKALALLCFLISRGFTATKDQVLDALWPDLAPDMGMNSLNQTVYFLRRILEEEYSEDLSPGYLWHDSDLVWLDSELIRTRSTEVRSLLRQFTSRPTPDEVETLVHLYHGRFAMEFEYEEWAASYRDTLHAAYLEVVERAVIDDLGAGAYDRGISVARRALEVEPSAEQIEVGLLRLYKATGAHAAAAEQYAHYSAVLRGELGLEPPALESL
jgi:DNA-binding SARP family transcriptional activator